MIMEVSSVSVVGKKIVRDEADWTSSDRLLQSRGLLGGKWAVTDIVVKGGRREVWKWTTEVDFSSSADERRWAADETNTEVQCRGQPRWTMTDCFNVMRSGARSQWKLARASMMWSERRRPAIDRAAAL